LNDSPKKIMTRIYEWSRSFWQTGRAAPYLRTRDVPEIGELGSILYPVTSAVVLVRFLTDKCCHIPDNSLYT
jgi:hypothetical protein